MYIDELRLEDRSIDPETESDYRTSDLCGVRQSPPAGTMRVL